MAAVFIKCFNYNIVLLNASNYRKSEHACCSFVFDNMNVLVNQQLVYFH